MLKGKYKFAATTLIHIVQTLKKISDPDPSSLTYCTKVDFSVACDPRA